MLLSNLQRFFQTLIKNAIIYCHGSLGNYASMKKIAPLVGENDVFDENKYFFISLSALGSPGSCSPSTTDLKNKFPKLKGRLTLANKREVECEVIGNTPFEKPLKKSVDAETIKKQLSKVDNYPYQITQINVNYDGTLFIPISKINQLRRSLFENLEKAIKELYSHDYKKITLEREETPVKESEANISFYTNNLNHLKDIENVKRAYLEIPPQDDSLDITSKADYNINYMVSFIKEAYEISSNKDYELIWQWPDIVWTILHEHNKQ